MLEVMNLDGKELQETEETLQEKKDIDLPRIGLDIGTFAVKGVLLDGNRVARRVEVPTAGNPIEATRKCLAELLEGRNPNGMFLWGFTGANADLLAGELECRPLLELEALQAGLAFQNVSPFFVLSLGHENMYYLELDAKGTIHFFNRNGQCAAGSGAFWYQQATRMGYDDRQLSEIALEADSPVRISGRCAVFAKSDMTHAINEGATQSAVSAGMAKALADMVITGVAQNRIQGPGRMLAVGGVANNEAVMKYIGEHCREKAVEIDVPEGHEFYNALGAAVRAELRLRWADLKLEEILRRRYEPENPLPPFDLHQVIYMDPQQEEEPYDFSRVYLGVDCGSVSTKCALVDAQGKMIGGVYLPTSGKPALQVLELMKEVEKRYGSLLSGSKIKACTTGSGRFLSQKILNAEYAVDEITCQAEGVKSLCGEEGVLSIIEIGGEDSKFLQLRDGVLYDYNMNPVCAAGTGTFLENLAGLLGVQIEEEFSQRAFQAEYAIDLGDTCTLLSQSTLVSAASQGLPLASQLASLAYSSARNYISKTVDNRPLEGQVIFTGATAKNHALASAFAAECEKEILVPPYPELSGALGSAVIARIFDQMGQEGEFSFRNLQDLQSFEVTKSKCGAECEHEHNCTLDVIGFADGKKFLYGDRCGRYSGLDRRAKAEYIPDYASRRGDLFLAAAGDPLEQGPSVGVVQAGLFFDLYPFWASFFRELGARVALSSPTSEWTLERGKRHLGSEMCYPLEVLVGHYGELVEKDLDYVFVPEVVDMEPLPWAEEWPRGFSCPLMQTVKGIVTNSLGLEEKRMLYAQLNYRGGVERIKKQLRPVAQKVMGSRFSESAFQRAVQHAYGARDSFRRMMMEESRKLFDDLRTYSDHVTAVFLGRSYTLYDEFVSKGSLDFARQRGLFAVPHEYVLEYLHGWYSGEISDPVLDGEREVFESRLKQVKDHMDNIYPIQLQKMLSTVIFAGFLNERTQKTGLPQLHMVLQDPFKCGPNAMLRHYLGNLTGYLRLTLDEHTAPAGMITRLEAFKNTCRSREDYSRPMFYSARTRFVRDEDWKKILVPEPTRHARIVAAMFRSFGVDAEVLPRSGDKDLSLARRYVNGEECLPLIQNVQDFLDYLHQGAGGESEDGVVFFQGWACGPCRYGLYAPTQSLIIHRAGFGQEKICSVKLTDALNRFGLTFSAGLFDGMMAMDFLYKMLHSTRPYEKEKGASDALFEKYSLKLEEVVQKNRFSTPQLLAGTHLRPLQKMLKEASQEFSKVPRSDEVRPRILVGGEFYVRLDDRCNQDIVRKIEQEGGEVSMAPATELFSYTAFINYQEARAAFETDKNLQKLLERLGYGFLNWLANRDEKGLEIAARGVLHDQEEPSPAEIRKHARKYVSEHYGGEPPMAIGRACAFARRNGVTGAIFVAPFTCMPGSVVESQMGAMREELGLPMITIYYDGKENANRDEFIESLVFQARQKLAQKNLQS